MDVPKTALSAEIQENWMPLTLGPMSLRPGLEYKGSTKGNLSSKHLPFVFSNTDTALLELTDSALRIRSSGVLLSRQVTATMLNGTFDTDLASWTDLDESTAVSSWLTGGYMSLLGDGTNAAIREQSIVLASSAEYGLRIVVSRGPVLLRVGSSSGGEQYIAEKELQTGTHSLALTLATAPATVYIRLFSRSEYPVLVDSCTFEAATTVELPTIWPTAALSSVRYVQSGDVVFVACYGYKQQRIERKAARSWSVVDYEANKGPFRAENISNITLQASALTGLVTLTASNPVFQAAHVGTLFKITSNGQAVQQPASADNTFTNPILVTGTGTNRVFGITISGTWVGTVTLQRSIGIIGNWTDVTTYTTNQSTSLDDSLSNQTIYYRLGIKTGGYTSGTATMELIFAGGSITGTARVSAVANSTSATAYVLEDFGSVSASTKWAEGLWSAYRGYPSSVALRGGRLYWAGKDKIAASVVDDYANFDAAYPGDAGPINRSIGEGPVDNINWMISASQLVLGGDAAEHVVRSNALDEPITPFNFNIRQSGTEGSYVVDAESLDSGIVFINKSGSNLISLNSDAVAANLNVLAPHILLPHVVDLAVQRNPETRLHAVRSDGTVAILVISKAEEVSAWVTCVTDGYVEEAVVLPGTEEDEVYYVVRRTVNSATVRYLELWAHEDECVGGTANKQVDSFLYYSGAATATISGLSHLEGRSVACWADGLDQGTFTVAAGGITLPAAVSTAVVGLPYSARFKSVKLASDGASMMARKRIAHLGLVLANTHAQGLMYGQDFDTMDDLPAIENGDTVSNTGIWTAYHYDAVELNGTYSVDSRLCLKATSPRPCTVLAAIMELES